MAEISKYAIIEPGAKIGEHVRIGPFSYIGPNVVIGNGCIVDNNVTITGNTVLGERNRVLPLAVIGTTAQSPDEVGYVQMGDANIVHEHAIVYGGAKDKPTRIGSDNLVMIGCRVGSGALIGDHGVFVNSTHIGDGAIIEDYVRTSGFIVIESGITVGAYAFTLGYAELDRDVPPFAMVQGSPCRIRGVNAVKLQRCGFGEDDIRAIKSAFRELYNGGGEEPDGKVLQQLLKDNDINPHVRRLAEAVKAGEARRVRE